MKFYRFLCVFFLVFLLCAVYAADLPSDRSFSVTKQTRYLHDIDFFRDYSQNSIPFFISADFISSELMFFCEAVERSVEQYCMKGLTREIAQRIYSVSLDYLLRSASDDLKEAAEQNAVYFGVCCDFAGQHRDAAPDEVEKKIEQKKDDFSGSFEHELYRRIYGDDISFYLPRAWLENYPVIEKEDSLKAAYCLALINYAFDDEFLKKYKSLLALRKYFSGNRPSEFMRVLMKARLELKGTGFSSLSSPVSVKKIVMVNELLENQKYMLAEAQENELYSVNRKQKISVSVSGFDLEDEYACYSRKKLKDADTLFALWQQALEKYAGSRPPAGIDFSLWQHEKMKTTLFALKTRSASRQYCSGKKTVIDIKEYMRKSYFGKCYIEPCGEYYESLLNMVISLREFLMQNQALKGDFAVSFENLQLVLADIVQLTRRQILGRLRNEDMNKLAFIPFRLHYILNFTIELRGVLGLREEFSQIAFSDFEPDEYPVNIVRAAGYPALCRIRPVKDGTVYQGPVGTFFRFNYSKNRIFSISALENMLLNQYVKNPFREE